jgi:tetratricopeptide (TPR) repeat protein/S1-C subfamily serine protease
MNRWNHGESLLGMCGASLLAVMPIVAINTAVTAQSAQAAAKSHEQVAAIAKASTVKVCPTQGSGIIIAKAGNTYTVLTNRHVLESVIDNNNPNACTKASRHSIIAPDGQKYLADASTIKNLPGRLDLAIFQFRSSKSYPIATFGNPTQITPGSKVHTAGYPASTGQFQDSQGFVIANSSRSTPLTNAKGYSMVYDAFTINGMSGSGVWNNQGQVVAIHGFGWRYEKGTVSSDRKIGQKIGWNMGIPITRFIQNAQKVGVALSPTFSLPDQENQNPSSDDYFIAAANKYIQPGGAVAQSRQEAIGYLNRALVDRPDYAYAFFLRGYLQGQNKNYPAELSDYNRAITLNPNFIQAYRNRGVLKFNQLQDYPGAIADLDKAIAIEPHAEAYVGRALVKQQHLQDYPGALQDYNKAIELNASLPDAYLGRGILKLERFQDQQGALQDFNQAIELSPNYVEAYTLRAALKQALLQDSPGALDDYNQAIKIDGNYASAYNGRGLIKALYVKDYPGALADYNRAIELNPQYLDAHINRGILKTDYLKDFQGALADYNSAIAIAPSSPLGYQHRGMLKGVYLEDPQGGLADIDRAIALAPNAPPAYGHRALLKRYVLEDKAGAIEDMRTAARLYKAQGRQREYQFTVRFLQELGATP